MAGRPELERGRCLRTKSLSKPTWNHHEHRQNNLFEIVCKRFCFFLTKKTWFHRKKFYFCMTNIYSLKKPEFEPLVSTWEPVFWSPWPQLKNVTCLTCTLAVILQKYFRLASVVCLSSLLGSLGKGVFERRTSTGSEILFILKWLDNTKFVFNFESLSYYRDDLSKILGKNTAQEWKKSTSGWRTSLKNLFA